ncbi:unnamed protein product [Urochloa humidicola]
MLQQRDICYQREGREISQEAEAGTTARNAAVEEGFFMPKKHLCEDGERCSSSSRRRIGASGAENRSPVPSRSSAGSRRRPVTQPPHRSALATPWPSAGTGPTHDAVAVVRG